MSRKNKYVHAMQNGEEEEEKIEEAKCPKLTHAISVAFLASANDPMWKNGKNGKNRTFD